MPDAQLEFPALGHFADLELGHPAAFDEVAEEFLPLRHAFADVLDELFLVRRLEHAAVDDLLHPLWDRVGRQAVEAIDRRRGNHRHAFAWKLPVADDRVLAGADRLVTDGLMLMPRMVSVCPARHLSSLPVSGFQTRSVVSPAEMMCLPSPVKPTAADRVGVPHEEAHLGPLLHIPETDGGVLAGGHCGRAIGTESEPQDAATVPLEAANFLPAANPKQANESVVATGQK